MTTRNRQATALTLACLCTALLAGCNNKSPEAGRPNTAPPPSGSASTATGSASKPPTDVPATPPERPKAALGLSLAAAEAFVYYYSDLLNYASDTGDARDLLTNSDSGCERCRLYSDFVKTSNAQNGLLTGDYHEHTKEVSELLRGSSGRLGGSAVVTVGAYVSKQTKSATPITSKPTTYKRELALSPQGGNWVMYEMKLVEQ
ncbi:DUF6318 family protein [Kribbella catacumbae]|uniref:DUF6318 family protein n=1 Tax=Kribbella catacumbae TaxID=460086 RepID=UPI0012F84F28|nr:DUF6318 family protein [Kribbella catacumbae]